MFSGEAFGLSDRSGAYLASFSVDCALAVAFFVFVVFFGVLGLS
jgi:hypothetical protein